MSGSMNLLLANVEEETTDNAGFVLFCARRAEKRQALIVDYLLTAEDAEDTAGTVLFLH